jgi:LacI family transcriptional regulator
MGRVTVQYIADQLGISKFAVSRALTGSSGVSEETRAAVVAEAARLGYVPRVRRRSSVRIEIIYHDPDVAHRELWVEVQAGAQMEGARLGIETVVHWTHDAAALSQLAGQANGFILMGPHDNSMLEAVRGFGVPCVRVGGSLPPLEPVDHVGGTDEEGAVAVATHLLGLGHRKFVYVHGQLGYPGRVNRLEHFREAVLAEEGTELCEISFPADNAPGDFRAALGRMEAAGFHPTAYFCGNDWVAVTVLTELMRLGVRVPEDASVVGFADYAIAAQTSPALTTVRVPFRRFGIAAIRLLLSRLGYFGEINDLPPQRINLVGDLMIRQSSGPATRER